MNRFKRWLGKTFGIFKIEEKVEEEQIDFVTLNKNFQTNADNWFKHYNFSEDEKTASEEVRKELFNDGAHFHGVGKYDGSIGIRKSGIKDVVISRVKAMQYHIGSIFRGKLEAAVAEKEEKSIIKDHMEILKNKHNEYLEQLNDYSQKYPKQHSFTIFILYLLIAIFLILADIPLALELTQQGFNFPSPDPDSEKHLTISALFHNPIEVLANNWEVFVLSIGIALCAVYVKILYDEFIEEPIQMIVTRFKNIPGVNYQNTDEILKMEKGYKFRKRIKVGLFIFTILTIVSLGFFRFEVIIAEGSWEPSFWVQLSFILITLLFPVVGGVCFSLALSSWQNKRRLIIEKKANDLHHDKYSIAMRNHSDAENKVKRLEVFVRDWTENNEICQNYIDMIIGMYNHGYERGLASSSKGDVNASLVQQIDNLRNQAISNSTYSHMLKAIDNLPNSNN